MLGLLRQGWLGKLEIFLLCSFFSSSFPPPPTSLLYACLLHGNEMSGYGVGGGMDVDG